jgi:hypothetical protein
MKIKDTRKSEIFSELENFKEVFGFPKIALRFFRITEKLCFSRDFQDAQKSMIFDK